MIDFNRKTKQLLDATSHGRIGIRKFEAIVPEIAKQVFSDSAMPWLSYWGQSLNRDEHEKATIVDPKILSLIGRVAQTEIRVGNTYHAGLAHSYGYLFSILKTRYGFKRERWTSGVIEKGLGLPKGVFSPTPSHGTLLSNLTFTLMNIALGNSPTQSAKFSKSFRDLPSCLTDLDFTRIKVTRITEAVEIPPHAKSKKTIRLMTDLVQLKHAKPKGTGLLVYSHKTAGRTNRSMANIPKLITCFPIARDSVQQLLKDSRSNLLPIKARYNASIPGFPVEGIKGRRSVG